MVIENSILNIFNILVEAVKVYTVLTKEIHKKAFPIYSLPVVPEIATDLLILNKNYI